MPRIGRFCWDGRSGSMACEHEMNGEQGRPVRRRDVLRAGLFGGAVASLAGLLRAESAAGRTRPLASSRPGPDRGRRPARRSDHRRDRPHGTHRPTGPTATSPRRRPADPRATVKFKGRRNNKKRDDRKMNDRKMTDPSAGLDFSVIHFSVRLFSPSVCR